MYRESFCFYNWVFFLTNNRKFSHTNGVLFRALFSTKIFKAAHVPIAAVSFCFSLDFCRADSLGVLVRVEFGGTERRKPVRSNGCDVSRLSLWFSLRWCYHYDYYSLAFSYPRRLQSQRFNRHCAPTIRNGKGKNQKTNRQRVRRASSYEKLRHSGKGQVARRKPWECGTLRINHSTCRGGQVEQSRSEQHLPQDVIIFTSLYCVVLRVRFCAIAASQRHSLAPR